MQTWPAPVVVVVLSVVTCTVVAVGLPVVNVVVVEPPGVVRQPKSGAASSTVSRDLHAALGIRTPALVLHSTGCRTATSRRLHCPRSASRPEGD
jgi:hypothetical protein